MCRRRPLFCPPVLDPVCGCDGETYDNGCQAAFVGVSVNHTGACSSGPQACGGTSGGTCGTNQYCKRPDGQCSESTEGVCTDIPGTCETIVNPVCGCNGATYDNACAAAAAGVTVDHTGACESGTQVCGGTSGGTCGPLEFCKRPDGACSEAAEGVCRHRPLFCPPVLDPVCGCDGETYDNGCQAAFVGVSVNHTGACSSGPQACGGTSGGTCGANQYCKRPDGQCSESTEGVCTDMPGTCQTIVDPVCGCNAATYDNACAAAAAGVSVDHTGACESGTQVCGGTSGGTCGPLEFCKRPDGACSEAAEGVCRHRPLFCPPVLDPVCGCDGETYDNGCQAAFVGVSVNHTGACSSGPQACGGTSGGTCGPNQYCKRPDGECSESAEGRLHRQAGLLPDDRQSGVRLQRCDLRQRLPGRGCRSVRGSRRCLWAAATHQQGTPQALIERLFCPPRSAHADRGSAKKGTLPFFLSIRFLCRAQQRGSVPLLWTLAWGAVALPPKQR